MTHNTVFLVCVEKIESVLRLNKFFLTPKSPRLPSLRLLAFTVRSVGTLRHRLLHLTLALIAISTCRLRLHTKCLEFVMLDLVLKMKYHRGHCFSKPQAQELNLWYFSESSNSFHNHNHTTFSFQDLMTVVQRDLPHIQMPASQARTQHYSTVLTKQECRPYSLQYNFSYWVRVFHQLKFRKH